jgi:predicted nicotinamide N-methyase
MPDHQHSRNAFGITQLLSRHKDLRHLKAQGDQPSIHGNKFWGSTYLLMDYLENHPLAANSKVMELGCGWGLAGIYCAKHHQAEVTAIDADDAVFPYLQLHAQHNDVTITTQQQYFENISREQLAQYDVLIGADICFWDELSDTLFELIERALEAGVKKIILTDPERAPFFELATRCIDEYFAELYEWDVDEPRRSTGCVLVIENE